MSLMLINPRTRRGGTELFSLPAALSSCSSFGKQSIDPLRSKRIGRKGVLCAELGKRAWVCVTTSAVLRFVLPSCRSCAGGPRAEPVPVGCSLVHRGETRRGTSASRAVLQRQPALPWHDEVPGLGPCARYPTGDTRNLRSSHCPEGKRETQTNEPQKTTMEGPRQKRRGQNEKAQCSSYMFGSKVCFTLKPAKQSLLRSSIQTSPKSVEIFSVGLAGPN